MLNEIENIIYNGNNISHSVTKFQYDEHSQKVLIKITPDTEKEYNKVFRNYTFENVSNFKYELEPGEEYDDWPRSVIGIDYYPKKENTEWNTVINCVDIEITFFCPELPEEVSI